MSSFFSIFRQGKIAKGVILVRLAGLSPIVEGIRNLVVRYWPEVIGVVTTCSSEIIGDDMVSFLKEAKKKLRDEIGADKADAIAIVMINTPSFAGSHVGSYNRAANAFLASLATERSVPNNKVNIIPGMIYPGDIREIKHNISPRGYHRSINVSLWL